MSAGVGPTVDALETVERLASWASLFPGSDESADIQYGLKTTRGNRYLKISLCRAGMTAGWSLHLEFQAIYFKFRECKQKGKGVW